MEKQTKQKLITDYFHSNETISKINSQQSVESKQIIRGYNSQTREWHCLVCGISMGSDNPRQLCRKIWCPFDDY